MEALDGIHVKSILVLVLTEVFIKVNGVYGTEQINNTSLPLYEMTVKPHEKVCFVCPVPKKSMAGIIWKYGDNKVYRDDTRLPSEQHLSLAVDTCKPSLRNHTLEISNISTSVPYRMFTCWAKTQLKAKFLVKGIPSVRIMFDDRIIPTAWDTERKLTNAELECRVDEAILPFNITWFIDSSMQHVDVYQVLLSNFTSVLLFNSTKIHTNVTCQVRGPFLVTQSATIMVVSPVTEMPTSKKNDETILFSGNIDKQTLFLMYVLIPFLFLMSILTTVVLYTRAHRHRRNVLHIMPSSRREIITNENTDQRNTERVVQEQFCTRRPTSRHDIPTNEETSQPEIELLVYEGIYDEEIKQTQTESRKHTKSIHKPLNTDGDDDIKLSLVVCLKSSGMFEYWNGTYSNNDHKNTKCFAKVLSGSATMNDAKNFKEMAFNLKLLRRHPNIVKLLCISLKEVPYSIVYENMECGSLSDFIKEQYQNTHQCREKSRSSKYDDVLQRQVQREMREMMYFSSNICRGLRFLARQKFCHPAVCLKKVLISSIGQCKLYDICPLNTAMIKIETLMKKDRPPTVWMPPESIFLHEYYSGSDAWGYAVLLWELFSLGEIPFAKLSNSEIELQLRGGFNLPQPLRCPGTVYGIMLSCWSNRKRDRPSFSKIAEQLKDIVNQLGQTNRAQPSVPAEVHHVVKARQITEKDEEKNTDYFVLESDLKE